jgi:hypothetical protein
LDAGTLLQKEVAQRRVNAAHEHEQLVTAIADIIAATAVGTSEIAAIIPTWITVTVGLASVLVEILGPMWTLSAIIGWLSVWGFLALKFFISIDYFADVTGFRVFGLQQGRLLSLVIVVVNLLVILLILFVWHSGLRVGLP